MPQTDENVENMPIISDLKVLKSPFEETHLQLFSRAKSKLSFKSIICSFFFTRLYEQIIDLYIIYLVNLGRLCIQYFSNTLLENCNNSLSKLRQIMS